MLLLPWQTPLFFFYSHQYFTTLILLTKLSIQRKPKKCASHPKHWDCLCQKVLMIVFILLVIYWPMGNLASSCVRSFELLLAEGIKWLFCCPKHNVFLSNWKYPKSCLKPLCVFVRLYKIFCTRFSAKNSAFLDAKDPPRVVGLACTRVQRPRAAWTLVSSKVPILLVTLANVCDPLSRS